MCHLPRTATAASRPRSWRSRRLRGVAVLIGCLALAAWVARRLGLPEDLSGALLGASILGALTALTVAMARRSGVGRCEALAWALALMVASVGPLLESICPGPILARTALMQEGDFLKIEAGRAKAIRVLVAAKLPEQGSVAFSFRAGPRLIEGDLFRGIRRWGTGAESRHHHEDRTSVLLDAYLDRDVGGLLLERVSLRGVPLRVQVHARVLPGWLVVAATLATLCAFAWRTAPLGGSREIIMAASVVLIAGLGAGSIATPEYAFPAVIGGLVLGLVLGIPSGAAIAALASGLGIRRQ